jgi:hypothetical protein
MPDTQERYELQLFKIENGKETMIEKREVPLDKIQQHVAQLPEREAMSLVNANLALPINVALAANILSDSSAAVAQAEQYAPVDQGIGGGLPGLPGQGGG